jgi:signal transduction histidine kinase
MDDLYTVVMHDVKNQLAELAQRLRERGDAQQEMSIAMNASRRLTEMLLLKRDESERLWVYADSVNPADFLEILASEYSELFPAIAIHVDVAYAPACAFFDETLVRMALGNALHNACRYARAQIQLLAFERHGMLILQVGDDGPGFTENLLSTGGKIPAAASASGTGLGLYLAHKIAALHTLQGQHGYIELSNAPGGQFRMILP